MDYEAIATAVKRGIGGTENIQTMTHCSTRLRITVVDKQKVDFDALRKIEGVIEVVDKGGQIQVVIGPAVGEVYAYFQDGAQTAATATAAPSQPQKNVWSRILDFIAGSFTPILPAIIGAGLLKGFMAIFVALHWLPQTGQTYELLSAIADACFYFLPVLLGFSAAKKLRANPYIAVVIAGVLLHPTFTAMVTKGNAISLLGLPVKPVSYASSVIPILLIVCVQSYLEHFLKKHLPQIVAMFVVPTVSIIVMSVLALTILGPLGAYIGVYLGDVIRFLNETVPWLAPTLMGAFSPLIVMLGMHYSLFPIALQSIATFGYDSFFTPSGLVANLAQAGAGLAVSFRARNQKMKATALSTGVTAVLGITEPVLYGVNLKLKKPLYAAMVGGAVGGLYFGLTHVVATALASPGVLALALFARTGTNLLNAVIGMVIAFAIAFVMTLIIWKPEQEDNQNVIGAAVEGIVMALSEVNDAGFSSGAMGPGVAIKPQNKQVLAPADGEVVMVFGTKHAYGLRTTAGAEILIHIGIDTVDMNGQGFTTQVQQGDHVKRGQLLGTFDRQAIADAGHDDTVMEIITNADSFKTVKPTQKNQVTVNAATSVIRLEK
ncbi:beta-glucoside-specific PTS transporter subunit IIABC [Lacticaseibacillus songhuajiangensis]|uniref:beta-glucoside-specific PTS transporter subunit IIABC n=1 Tax=Lacticaseibacillus songhuajiangensis TaxID=1296539 RepID=UPI000F76EC8F|nr:beta-glucoside-specific PTS transporter subunit IIABC [Lacticaseibacillus songhuajiangensis]